MIENERAEIATSTTATKRMSTDDDRAQQTYIGQSYVAQQPLGAQTDVA